MVRKVLGLVFLFLVVGGYVGAFTMVDDFDTDPSSRWSLNGNAGWTGYRLVLTPDISNQRSSIWYSQSFNLSKYSRLEAEFDMYLGLTDGGADGITFALIDVSNGLNVLGGYGGGLGYGGIGNSLAVEFDTFYNSEADTISSDHVGVDLNGQTISGVVKSLTAASLGNVEDNNWHHVKVDFDLSEKTISVYVDNFLRINNFVVSDFTPFEAYIGFTGATGGAHNLQEVDNFKLELTPVPLPGAVGFLGGGLFLLGIGLRRKKSS